MSAPLQSASASLAVEFELRLRAMARRWKYTDEDLAEVLALARAQPDAWLRAVALDERRTPEFERAGLIPTDRPLELRDFVRRGDWLVSSRWRIFRRLNGERYRYTLWDFGGAHLLIATADSAQALLDLANQQEKLP